ncbi:hypothetical protein O3P69_011136 [Scylla paramamosain]|uniref:Uncharacterized protein n=1 Tax=Scylla paramamosain TaxID=85552 RepID=A0AAW0SU41_SCYPA
MDCWVGQIQGFTPVSQRPPCQSLYASPGSYFKVLRKYQDLFHRSLLPSCVTWEASCGPGTRGQSHRRSRAARLVCAVTHTVQDPTLSGLGPTYSSPP